MRHGIAAVYLLARLTVKDFSRRRDPFVVALMMGLFLLFAVVVRLVGVETDSAARFLMSAGLALSHLLAALLVAAMAARSFPEEFEHGAIMPLLAKPVSRGQVLFGKWVAVVVFGGVCLVLFMGASLFAVPLVAGQSAISLFQVFVLQLVGLLLLAALTMFLSFFWPPVLAGVVALLWYFGGSFFMGVCRDVLVRHVGDGPLLERVFAMVPEPSLLFHSELFAAGLAPMAGALFGGLLGFGLAWTALFYFLAQWKFATLRI